MISLQHKHVKYRIYTRTSQEASPTYNPPVLHVQKSQMVQYIADSTYLSYQISSRLSWVIPCEKHSRPSKIPYLLPYDIHTSFVYSAPLEVQFECSLPYLEHRSLIQPPKVSHLQTGTNLWVIYILSLITPQMVPCKCLRDSYYYKRTHIVVTLQSQSHKLLTCLPALE